MSNPFEDPVIGGPPRVPYQPGAAPYPLPPTVSRPQGIQQQYPPPLQPPPLQQLQQPKLKLIKYSNITKHKKPTQPILKHKTPIQNKLKQNFGFVLCDLVS